MKKQSGILRRLIALALILCMLTALTAEIFAADIVASGNCGGEGDGTNLKWTLDSQNVLTISGTGKMANYSQTTGAPWYNKRTQLKKIVLDPNITSIGDYAFHFCYGLTGNLTIPDGVTYIGAWAFSNCSNLTGELIIPDSVTSIGDGAFRVCTFTSVVIPDGMTRIGDNVFEYCYDLTAITIPDSVTSIGDYAFQDCCKLTKILIPDGVTSIGDYAFSGCESLTNVTIPRNTTRLTGTVFNNCSSLNGIVVESGNIKYDSRNGCNAIVETKTNCLISGCKSTQIPNSVTSIGEYAFGGCKFTEIVIPDSVTSIGDNAFRDCGSLTNILIPNSVSSIGAWAFISCNGITSITIPGNVRSIGEAAFSSCNNLEKVKISGGVISIGISAFSGCGKLTSISIPDSVTSIGSGAFFECNNLVDIKIPRGVTKIEFNTFTFCTSLKSVTIPNSVICIGDGAFNVCESLTSIVIPNSVTNIESYAFSGCRNLENIYFYGNAPVVGDYAFDSCKSSFTINYVSGKNGWTDSPAYNASAGTWNGYPLKTWDGAPAPSEADAPVPKGKYCIQVVDETGAPISGADVKWNNDTVSTDQDGRALFDLFTFGNPTVQVSKLGYLTWTNENTDWQKNEKRFERVILYPESYGGLKLKSAKIGRCDLLTQTKVLNLRNDGALVGDLNSGYFALSCAATNTSDAAKYAVYQNTKKIAESIDGTFSRLNVRDFAEGGGCFVRVTGVDGKAADTHINLQFAENAVNEGFKFELKGNKISFDVDGKIPYVGGSNIAFELPIEVPIVVSATAEKLQFGINLNLTNDKSKDEQIDDYIKMIKKASAAGGTNLTKANAKALKNCAAQHNKAEFFKSVEFTFCGYAEADLGSNTASGYMILIADVEIAKFQYNTVVWVIPITIQVGVDFSLEAGGMLSYRFDTKTWNGNIFLNPSIGLSPFVGIGYSDAAGAGAYGSADLAVGWNVFGTNRGLQTVDLTGELGIKAYAGAWEWHKSFAHQTWHLYTANSVKTHSLLSGAAWDAAPEASAYAPSDLSYLAEESDWAPAAVRTYAARAAQARTEYHPLLENTYRNAQPVMISDGSALYAAFVRANETTGKRYVALTKFDGTSWSAPAAVDASAILDDAPQLCTDAAGNLWLAYARTTQDPGNSLVTYAQNQTIVVGTVNKDTLAFTAQKTYQSDNYMHLPALSCVNGTPVLAWAGSAVTDEESVVNPASKTIYTAEYKNGAWPDAPKVTEAAAVSSICIGAQNGVPAVAYTADGKLYCSDSVLAENVTGRAVYGKLPGAAGESFIWNADGALHDEAGNTVPVEGLGRDFVIVGDSIYFNQSNGASANLAVLQYDAANKHWSAPILLIGDEQYLENLNAAMLGDKTYALGMHTTVTIGTDSVEDSKDLVWTQIQPVSDLKLSDVSFDSDALTPGETLPVTLTVTNAGDHAVSSVTITAGDVSTTQDCTLLPGESTGCTVNITCPSAKRTVDFAVQEPGQDDYTPEDNTTACTIGSADAETELTLIQIGSRRLLQAAVTNRGLEPASGSVLFTGPDGELLAERTFQNLTYGGTVIAEFEPESFSDLYGEDVTATVTLQQDEPNTLNNTDSVPILLTATEILSAQRGGSSVTAEIACMHDSARALCAFYDATGRLLRTAIQPLESGKINSLTFQIDSNAAQAKLFVLDAKNAPAAPARSIPLNS